MNREEFEQLLSAWLDEPQHADLRATLEAAIARDPQYAKLRDDYARLEELIHQACATPDVNWGELKARIRAEVERLQTGDDDRWVDERIRAALPDLDDRVDWEKVHERISQAVAGDAARRHALRVWTWRGVVAAGLTAAAAALVLWLNLPPTRGPQPPSGPVAVGPGTKVEVPPPVAAEAPGFPTPRIHAEVLPPVRLAAAMPTGPRIARATVMPETEVAPELFTASTGGVTFNESDPEVFFLLEPPDEALTLASASGARSP